MKIKDKLRRLLLTATLFPLLLNSGIFLTLLSGLGTHFASDTKKSLLISRLYGNTADYAREEGEDFDDVHLVFGVRLWF